VIDAGVKMIISFINGVADAIRNNSSAMGAAGANLGTAVVEGMARGIAGGIGVVTDAAKRMAKNAISAAMSTLGAHSPSKEFEKVGKYVVQGFAKGLTGNKDAINAAYENMKSLLKTAISAASQDIKDATAKLKKLRSARHKDTKAIKAAEAALRTARAEHKKASAAYTELTKKLADEKNKLKSLAGQYDKITEKLKNAQQVLDDAKKTRDDYAQSIRDQYGDIPDITKETKLTDFIIGLEKQIAETTEFASAVQRLRDLGLSDQMYKELLARGPAALPFMQELLASGQDGVDFINNLGSDLDAAAGSLGKTASEELYQAGVDMAQGLVNGLKKEQEALEKLMDKLADRIVKTLKKKLGIKSPSTVFEKIGQQSDEGLAKGLKKYSDLVEKSAENVGKDAILAMSKSISGIAAAVDRDVDLQPTIRPELDLTDVRKAASRIGDILKTQPISLQGAYSQARDASAGYLSNRAAAAFGTTQPDRVMTGDQYNFIQNNTSPKALSSAEIYRQTNNQISRAKGALAKK
jgi:flagellar biosynthesis chaperone FliJ